MRMMLSVTLQLLALLAATPGPEFNSVPEDGVGEAGDATSQETVIQTVPRRAGDNPLFMSTGKDAKVACGDLSDGGSQIACLSWINGASAGYGWTVSRSPAFFRDYCPREIDYNLGERRDIFIAYLNKASEGTLTEPAILLFREAMAEAYPCSQGEP